MTDSRETVYRRLQSEATGKATHCRASADQQHPKRICAAYVPPAPTTLDSATTTPTGYQPRRAHD